MLEKTRVNWLTGQVYEHFKEIDVESREMWEGWLPMFMHLEEWREYRPADNLVKPWVIRMEL